MSASVSERVRDAVAEGRPVVALETAVLTHGLPKPLGLETVLLQVRHIQEKGAVAAIVGLLDGEAKVGLTNEELLRLSELQQPQKVNLQNLSVACHAGASGGTTVSATMQLAHLAGIRVMATGGIGGVHRGGQDVSTDLVALSAVPMVVVCSGPKAVLDVSATLERLEAYGVPVVGYGTDHVPAFYSADSGWPATGRVDTPEAAASLFRSHLEHGVRSAVLLCNPPPADASLPWDVVQRAVDEAERACVRDGVSGRAVTPRLLEAVTLALDGANLRTNTALLVANARLAAEVACAMAP
ncbi:MAG: pseudouridine-5'-phosphate glycosidase [Fimbriimonadales bacterium]